jgi:hypothetical protein
VNSTEEQVLRQRLREETSQIENGPAPVDAILRRGRAIRARRRGAAVSCVAVIAVAVAVTASVQALSPAGKLAPSTPVGHPSRHKVTLNVPDPRAPGGVFASGIADGRPWRLAARNVTGPAPRCLPAVMLNGQNGDLLNIPAGAGLIVGNWAFWNDASSQQRTGVAFAELGSRVTSLSVTLRDGSRFAVRPVSVTLCGQQFRLAGFGYPASGVRTIAAYRGDQATVSYSPPRGTFSPASPLPAGTWDNTAAASNAASGLIGAGTVRGTPWRLRVTLGGDGECFEVAFRAGGAPGSASICRPIGMPPAGVSLITLPYNTGGSGILLWYMGTVSERTVYLRASLSDGTTARLVPMVVAGRKYFALATAKGVIARRLTLYDGTGHAFASTTAIPVPPQPVTP